MKDQVAKFSERGLKCAYVGEEQDDPAVKAVVVEGDRVRSGHVTSRVSRDV